MNTIIGHSNHYLICPKQILLNWINWWRKWRNSLETGFSQIELMQIMEKANKSYIWQTTMLGDNLIVN